MKRLIVSAAALIWAGAAFAGDWHYQGTLKCSECHTMHASRAHGVDNGAAGPTSDFGWTAANQDFPHGKLLLKEGVNATCLACHDGNGGADVGVPDVYGANGATNTTVYGRSAGALNGAVAGFTLDAGYEHWMGHTLESALPPPGFTGSTWGVNFNCGHCHAIHGSDKFRNLGNSPMMGAPSQKPVGGPYAFVGVGPEYNAMPNQFTNRDTTRLYATHDVTILAPGRSYNQLNVKFNGTATGGMNAYCAVCHGNFHGADNVDVEAGDIGNFKRHPTTGDQGGFTTWISNFGADDGTAANRRPLVARPGWRGAPGTGGGPLGTAATNFDAACLSCHKAHGSTNTYALIDSTGGDYEGKVTASSLNYSAADPGFKIRNTCIACHEAF